MNITAFGKGDPLILIHGWGMSSKIFINIAEKLTKKNKVYLIDLPGMGKSQIIKPYEMTKIIDEINLIDNRKISILGWSLGGQIAIAFENKYPDRVKKLILVSTTPCFLNNDNWRAGIEKSIFEDFAKGVLNDWRSSMRRFFNLQLLGSDDRKIILTDLENNFLNTNDPSIQALIGGLNILMNNDLREIIKKISVPVLIISGAKDKLIPPQAAEFMLNNIKHSILRLIDGAAHIPFMSHQDQFVEQILEFSNIHDK